VFTQIAKGGRGFTELARLSLIALLVGANKVFILVFCSLSVLAVYEVRRQRGLAVFGGINFSVRNYVSAVLPALLRWNWEELLFTSAVGHSTLILKVARHGWA